MAAYLEDKFTNEFYPAHKIFMYEALNTYLHLGGFPRFYPGDNSSSTSQRFPG